MRNGPGILIVEANGTIEVDRRQSYLPIMR